VTAAERNSQQDIEQCKPVSPANHLGDFFTVALTMSYHNVSFVSPKSALVRFVVVDRRLQRAGKRVGYRLALSRGNAGVDKVSDHVSQHHQGKVSRRLMFFQYVEHLGEHLFNVFVTVAGDLW